MGVSKTTLICLIFVLIFSVFFARLSNMITVSDFPSGILNNFTENEGLPGKESLSAEQKNLFIDDSFEHLLWFVQVSDIHISIFHDPSRSTQFKEFCDLTIDAIKPSVVLASGDLTDAKSPDNMGSRQYIQEWETYSGILQECQINNKTVWLDIRGNHDNFNVPSLDSKENYYRNYSIQGPKHPKSYLYQVSKGGEKYSFIAMDACLEPGPRRPFNFVGLLTHEETEHVSHLADVAKKRGGNYTIWFGHYPTSCILSPGEGGVRSLLASHREGLAYLCGHFHTLGGTVPNMYTLQQAGFLELELGDWKDNRLYRIAAIDHGLFSFVDVAHREWPVILVTNPKHALFKIPSREPLSRMVSSTHIRLLVFSISSIVEVKLKLDEEEWRNCTLVEGPLYVTPWNATSYMTGVHYIYVEATDENGRSKSITQPFSLDGSRLTFQLLPRIVLMSNVSLIFQFMFGIMLVTCVLPLCVFRYLHKIYKVRKLGQPKVSIPLIDWWLRKFWILSTVNRIYYPLVLYSLYLSVGPWSVGEVIDGYTGIIFAWGTIIDGVYLPGSFTYAYGFLHMFTFQFPLTVIMAHSVDKRLRNFGLVKPQTAVNKVCHHAPFFLLLAMQMMYAYFFWLAYGTMAFLLGPMRTWSMLLAIYLWWQVSVLPDKCFKEAFCVWSNGNYPELTPEESQRIKES